MALEVLSRPENKWLKDRFAKYGAGDQRSRFAWVVIACSRTQNCLANIEPVMLEPGGVNVDPDGAFWKSTPERKKLHDRFVALTPKVPVTVTTTFDPIGAIAKIPILGPILKAAAAPMSMAVSLAQGERFDHALLDAAKSQLGGIKAIAPYAATVVSFIPGIGTGVAAAIAAGAALAEGKPIDQALEEAIKSAIPGGAIAVAAFDLAKKVASGQNVGKAVLETARSQLPPAAQKAFDVGVAVTSGKKLQDALISAVGSLAPSEIKQILDVGAKAVQSVPGLSSLAKSLPTDIARQGLQLASGALAHAGVNEAQLRAMRSKLTGDMLKGFDTALHAQAAHFPWVDNVVAQAPAPIVQEPPLTKDQQDLIEISMLSPEQQQQLVAYKKQQDDLQKLAQLSPEQRKQLVDYANAKNAPPKPHELPAKPVSTPKPHEPPAKKATEPSTAIVTRAAAPAAAARPSPAAPAGGPVYGPYPSGMPGGALHGALGWYGAYPGVLSAPHPHPHPPHHGGGGHSHRTWGWGGPWWGVPFVPDASTSTVESCRVWGNAVVLPPAMERAARAALGASRGQPTMVRGPDGVLYLFAFENGQLAARPCAAVGT